MPTFPGSPITKLSNYSKSHTSSAEEWMGQLNYSVAKDVTYSSRDPEEEIGLMLGVSPTMRANFYRYGDIVSVGIIKDAPIDHSGKERVVWVCLFAVSDTNNRPLIVAVGLLPDCSSESIGWAIGKFVEIHGNLAAVCTPYSQNFKTAVLQY